jgi:hypothetical protein
VAFLVRAGEVEKRHEQEELVHSWLGRDSKCRSRVELAEVRRRLDGVCTGAAGHEQDSDKQAVTRGITSDEQKCWRESEERGSGFHGVHAKGIRWTPARARPD